MRALLIGAGAMGSKHYRTLKNNPQITEVLVVDPQVKTIEDTLVSNDLGWILDTHEIDFAIIATPTVSHYDLALKLMKRGVNILVEKPLASSPIQSLKLVETSKNLGVKVAVGHIERFNPAIQALKAALHNKKILHLELTRVSPYPTRIGDVGVKLDLGIHDLDLVRFLIQEDIEIEESCQSAIVSNREDTATFFLKSTGGASSTVCVSWMFPYRERKAKILTDQGVYEADLMRQQVVKYTRQDNQSWVTTSLFIKREDALARQLNCFLEYLKTGELGDIASVEQAHLAVTSVTRGDY